jgi:hypothetical protein
MVMKRLVSILCGVGLLAAATGAQAADRMFARNLPNNQRIVLVVEYDHNDDAYEGYYWKVYNNQGTGRFKILQKTNVPGLNTVLYRGVFKQKEELATGEEEVCSGKITLRQYDQQNGKKLLGVIFEYDVVQDEYCSLAGKTENQRLLEIENPLN